MKKVLSIVLVLALAFSFAACAKTNTTTPDNSKKLTVIKVGASPAPHAEILEQAKPLMEAKGYDLQIVEFTDYVMPNTSLEDGSIDANYFQHQPYLTDFNAKNGTHLVSIAAVHFEPLGVYPGKSTDFANVPDGAKIGVPNDTSNEARALQLLAAQGLIKLKDGVGLEATPKDIVENTKNIEIVELEAATIPQYLPDLDFAIINGNYALEAGVADKVLTTEDTTSEAAQTFANILVVKEGNEDNAGLKALAEVLTGTEISNYIKDTYNNVVIPMN